MQCRFEVAAELQQRWLRTNRRRRWRVCATVERPSVCLSCRVWPLDAAVTSGWVAAELGRVQQISLNRYLLRLRVASCEDPRYEEAGDCVQVIQTSARRLRVRTAVLASTEYSTIAVSVCAASPAKRATQVSAHPPAHECPCGTLVRGSMPPCRLRQRKF